MRIISITFLLFFHLFAFGQTDSPLNYYQSSNNKHIVEIKNEAAYVYYVRVYPDLIAIYSIDTLPNVLTDSTSGEQLQLYYTDEWLTVEKRGLAYFLIISNAAKRPRKTLELNPVMDQQQIERSINVYQRYWFQTNRLHSLNNEFPDYQHANWENDSMEAQLNKIPTELPREVYLAELKRIEQGVYDSVRGSNIKYEQFIAKIAEQPVSLAETKTIYSEINSRDNDFIGYKYHLINELIDQRPELFFSLAAAIESEAEREELFLSMNNRRYRKLKTIEADADLKAEFRRAHRNNTIANIGLYTLESVSTFLAAWLLSI